MRQIEFTGYGPCPNQNCGEEHDHTRTGISPDASSVVVRCRRCKQEWTVSG